MAFCVATSILRRIVIAPLGVVLACSSGAPSGADQSADVTAGEVPDASASRPSPSPSPSPPAPSATPPDAGACVAPAGAKLADQDPADDPEAPWPKPAGGKISVHFQNDGAAPRYWDDVAKAAAIWSASPCIEADVVSACPADSNCVHVTQAAVSPDGDDTDGDFTGDDTGDGASASRRGGTLRVFTGLMDKESDNGALATIVHEMGHALGLVHRLKNDDVMNADTSDETNPDPDPVDFQNLLVIYGSQP
jgi:hypothetical protein